MIELLLALQLSTALGLPPPPPLHDRVDQVLMLGSAATSSIALGLTLSCIATNDCGELNPVMRKFLGDGPTRAATVKSVGNAVTIYAVWRTLDGKRRTAALATLFAVNAWDAIHDIRVMRTIQDRKDGFALAVSVPLR